VCDQLALADLQWDFSVQEITASEASCGQQFLVLPTGGK
jgi:hypothetical protein